MIVFVQSLKYCLPEVKEKRENLSKLGSVKQACPFQGIEILIIS